MLKKKKNRQFRSIFLEDNWKSQIKYFKISVLKHMRANKAMKNYTPRFRRKQKDGNLGS